MFRVNIKSGYKISKRFDAEGMWPWKFDKLRGRLDWNNTIPIPIFVFTLTPIVEFKIFEFSTFAKKSPITIKIYVIPCFAMKPPRAISSNSSPQFWR